MAQKTRAEIPEQDKWDLTKLYAEDRLWEEAFKAVDSKLSPIVALKGRVCESGETLASVFELQAAFNRELSKLSTYASHKNDEDSLVPVYSAMKDRVSAYCADAGSKIAWIKPEIFAAPKERVAELQEAPAMKPYLRALQMLLQDRDHTLGAAEEALISLSGDALDSAHKTYRMLTSADMKLGKLTKPTGEEFELTLANCVTNLRSFNRDFRRSVFERLYDRFGDLENTFAATLDGQVRRDAFYAKARKFGSSLEYALHDDVVPTNVYTALIEAVHSSLPQFYEYVALRKKCLGAEKLEMFDNYVPIVADFKMEVSYEQACDWIREALAPLGPAYLAMITEALTSRWIDKYSNKGKRSGAYSGGCYDSPPYILTNFENDLDSCFTLAHELGHSMHTLLSRKGQPYIYSEYRIFVAEVASTVNEGLLHEYLLKKAIKEDNWKLQAYLLNSKCDNFKGTVFRQVMFAEFELLIHEQVEKGQALTPEYLCNTYYDLNAKYFGPDLAGCDKRIGREWMRIPHFYYTFYVFKYSTSFSVSEKVVSSLLNQQQPAAISTDKYLQFLSAGCSLDPLDLLTQHLGLDLTKPDVVADALSGFSKVVKMLSGVLDAHKQ